MTAWIATLLIIAFHLYVIIKQLKQKHLFPSSRKKFYLRNVGSEMALLLFFWLLVPSFYEKPDFAILGKGYIIPYDIYSGIKPFFTIPLVFSLINLSPYRLKEMGNEKSLFGCPIPLLPLDWSEFGLFNLFIISGAVFEELLCRQFLFFAFNATMGLQGDVLLISSSFLFALGHVYQGWKGVLGAFVTGLLLGKAFQMSGSIFLPIVLHLCLNLTLSVLVFRRIKDGRKLKKAPELVPVESLKS